MKKFFLTMMFAVAAMAGMAQTIGEAFYIYRNDGQFNAFFRDEVDSIAYSNFDADSVFYDEVVMQVVYTADSIYRIPLAAVDSVAFVTPETKYKPGVKQIVGELRDYVISSEQMSITFASNTPQSLLPRVGDKLVTLEMSDVFPIGFAGEVVDVKSGENYVVQCDTTDLTNIFERYYSSSSLAMTSDSIPNSVYGPQRASYNDKIPIPVFSRTIDVSAGVDLVDDLAFDLGASIGTTITTNCHLNCIFNIDWGKLYLKADIINDVTLTEDMSVSGKVSLSKDFPIGVPFQYPIIPFVHFYAEAGAFVNFSAELCWGSSYTQRFHSEFHMLYDSQNPENNYRYGSNRHVGTDRQERVITGGGTASAGGYLEAGVNVVCKDLAKVGLRGELGIKVQLQATVHRSDFQDVTRSSRLYDLLNADRSVTAGLYGGFRFVGGFWKFHASAGIEGSIGGNLFEGGLVPRFSNLTALRDVSQYGMVNITSDLSRDCLLPVKIGFQLFDENDNPVEKQFYSVAYQHENLSSYGMNFISLSTNKKYKVRPVVSLFDHDLLASPSADVDQSLQVVTHEPSGVEATKAILWGQVTGYDNQNDNGPVGFYYSNQGNPLTSGGQKLDAGMLAGQANGIFSATLSNLEQDKKYYYIAAYKDNDGEMHYGEVQQFTTKKGETSCPDSNHPHMIDLGLPSGTKWACCNVGASVPEDYGNYYAWGETQPKSVYDWDTYQYGYYNYDGDHSHLVNIGSDIAGTSYDAATVNWGAPWRMPSLTQIQELLNNTSSTWTTENGVYGRKFTGSNGGSIFLPAAGERLRSDLCLDGSDGEYWSSSLYESHPYRACILRFYSLSAGSGDGNNYRYRGQSVRPVRQN